MEFKIEILVRDLNALAMTIGGGIVIKKIQYKDEEKTAGIDELEITIEAENAHLAFNFGRRFQEKIKPFTLDELNDMETGYEYKNDL